MQGSQAKLLSVIIAGVSSQTKSVIVMTREYQLSEFGFFQKGGVKDAFKFIVRESLPVLDKGTRNSIEHDEHFVHVFVTKDQLAGYAFVSKAYPRRLAFAMLNECLNAFRKQQGESWKARKEDDNITVAQLKKVFERYQDITKVDKLSEASKKVEETNVILHDNLKKLLERQGDLEELIGKSKDLSQASKLFLKQSKEMNSSCCSLV